jgi:iron complex outermembrane recepter protein
MMVRGLGPLGPLCRAVVSVGLIAPALAHAEAPATVAEVVVTAQKQEQAANTVGMSITAATGDTLVARGINSVDDLVRVVPGLTIQYSAFNSTSFTLRGVGFFNSDLATPAAVTVYVDEAPLPYPAMTKLVAFDLARVEVLKGPQGTLFGENATGGAVNYIAAKPTGTPSEGLDASYGNFNRAQIGGFAAGPINDQLSFRVALQWRDGGPWQESITRPGDGLGRISEFQGRATLDWRPNEMIDSRLTFTATHDGDESEAAQFVTPRITIPALSPGLASFPVLTTPRAADWATTIEGTNQPFPYASNTNLYQLTWRNDVRLKDGITVTSLTSLAGFRMNYGQDEDGTPLHTDEIIDRDGKVASYFQEVRATGTSGRLVWLVGANLEQEDTSDDPVVFVGDDSAARVFLSVDPGALGDVSMFTSRLRSDTFAGFGRLQYSLGDRLSFEGAIRYNRDERTFDNCETAATPEFAQFWNLFRGETLPLTKVGDCIVINTATGLPASNVHNTLNQDSVSWRAGVNWTERPGLLLYANISKGYKAGAAPVLGAATTAQYTPVPQESLLAYEAGTKASLFDQRVQFNAAAFYYDYHDKQLRGAQLDPVFGPLQALVSIPQSHVVGAEAQLVARPIQGLTLDTSATYVHTAIDRFAGFNGLAQFGNQAGTAFPFSPTWVSITNLDYEFPLFRSLMGFVGGSLTYNSQTNAGIGAPDPMTIDAFVVVDLRAGVTFKDGRYRAWLWGKNVANTDYWNNVYVGGADVVSRFVGQPATYGASVSARF